MGRWLAALWLLGAGTLHAADMIVVRYVDQDPGDPPYLTRILVTPDFLRMDGGEDDGDFVLLDRRQRQVINVMRDSRLAMVFRPGVLPPKPAGWKPRLDAQAGAPGTRRFSLVLNDVVCSEGVAAAAAAPDAARAMAEFKARAGRDAVPRVEGCAARSAARLRSRRTWCGSRAPRSSSACRWRSANSPGARAGLKANRASRCSPDCSRCPRARRRSTRRHKLSILSAQPPASHAT